MRAATLACLGACLCAAPPVGRERPDSLHEVVKRLVADTKKPGRELIEAGMTLIKAGAAPRLSDELAFLTALADRGEPGRRRKDFEDAAKALELKYEAESHSLLRVLLREADLYRDGLGDRPKEREALGKAERLQEKLLVREALSRLAVFNKLGENHLGVVDATTDTQKKARAYFTRVIEFEFPGRPTHPSYGAYQTLYIEAASRLVKMADEKELEALRFHPFALATLHERHPKKAKLLSGENPWVAAFDARVERWLESAARELPKGSTTRAHFEGVLRHVRKGKPDQPPRPRRP